MPKIEFRGKTYNNEFEMPLDVCQAYSEEKERSRKKNDASSTVTTDQTVADKSTAKDGSALKLSIN